MIMTNFLITHIRAEASSTSAAEDKANVSVNTVAREFTAGGLAKRQRRRKQQDEDSCRSAGGEELTKPARSSGKKLKTSLPRPLPALFLSSTSWFFQSCLTHGPDDANSSSPLSHPRRQSAQLVSCGLPRRLIDGTDQVRASSLQLCLSFSLHLLLHQTFPLSLHLLLHQPCVS